MKKIHLTFINLLFISLIYAQSTIIDLDNWDGESQENVYYKDINNYFDDFVGTWVYTSGNTTFKIVLRKETMLYTGKFYTDYMVGEYQYIEDGIEIINTLDNTDLPNVGIWGNTLLKSDTYPLCSDCTENERRASLSISDNVRDLHGDFTLKLITVNGQPAIEGLIYGDGVNTYDPDNPPPHFEMAIPSGYFTFIKE